MNIITDIKALDKAITSIAGRSKTLRADIGVCAHSVFVHAAEHGDLTKMSRLVRNVSPSHATTLRKYFAHFGPVRWDKKAGQFKKIKRGGPFDPAALDVAWDAKLPETDKPEAEYNRDKMLTSIVKFLDTKASTAVNAGDAAMCEVLVDVAATLARLTK